MNDILLYYRDDPCTYKTCTSMTFNNWILTIEYGYITHNGINDIDIEYRELNPCILQELYKILCQYTDDISIDDLLLNDQLIHFYIKNVLYKDIELLFLDMIDRDSDISDEESYITLANDYQAYGYYLEEIDIIKSIDAYIKEKEILEKVYQLYPDSINKNNISVSILDLIRVYEKLDMNDIVLELYLSLLDYDIHGYELGHIYEKIGLLYSKKNTVLDMDDINDEDDYVRLSIKYHLKEKAIFKELYKNDPTHDHLYNYTISLRQLGLRYESLEEYNKALEYFHKVYDYLIDMKDIYRDSYITSLEHLGNIYYDMNDDHSALEYYLQVEELEFIDMNKSHDIFDIFSMAIIEKKIGRTYLRLDSDKCIEYFKKALEFTLKVQKEPTYEHQSELGICFMNLGWAYYDTPDKAYVYFKKDLEIREKLYQDYQTISSHYSLSLAYRHMGYIYIKLHNYKKALDYFYKCLDISKLYGTNTEGKRHYLSVSTYDVGYCLYLLKEKKALKYYKLVNQYFQDYKETKHHEYTINKDKFYKEYEIVKYLT